MDLIIVGAGIAGLHVATRYLQSNPSHQILLIERNSYIGGRIYTHHQTIKGKKYQWEAGAGRIALTHKRVIGLIKEYGLTFTIWSQQGKRFKGGQGRGQKEEKEQKEQKDPFPDLIPVYLKPLLSLPPHVLAQNTLDTLLHGAYGQQAKTFMALFPYWAEFHTLRADIALQAFMEGPLGGTTGYGGCVEGLSALTDRMAQDVLQRGGTIRLGTSLVRIDLKGQKGQKGQKDGIRILLQNDTGIEWLQAKKVVLAMDATSLQKMKLPNLPVLHYLKAEPLLRTYAVFPVKGANLLKGGKSWFSGMAKEVVPGPIRFFIPMDETKGLAMISYTEGRDALYWMNMPEKRRTTEMMKALRELYKEKVIPDPIVITFHGWSSGCTYWTRPLGPLGIRPSGPLWSRSGSGYNVEEESEKSVQPIPGLPLYLCSESFAVQQSWMESSLVQAEKVLTRL